MAVSDAQKVDLLYKKLFGVAKTDNSTNKAPSNESIASPAFLRGDTIWTQSTLIPNVAANVSTIVQGYTGGAAVQCTADTTTTPISTVYPTWKTSLTNWVPPEFGATYLVKVYAAPTGQANVEATGTQLSAAGSGGTGEWYFDPVAGVLNFIGQTIPSALSSSNVIYIVGYRYIGTTGVSSTSNVTAGNINIANNSIISTNTNGNILLTPNGSGNVLISSNATLTGNATVNGLTVNASGVFNATLQAKAGIQATPIGNVAPSTAIFTSESVSGNSTVNGLTVNTSAVVTSTLQAVSGIQNTVIGNVTAAPGYFTSINTTADSIMGANLTVNGNLIIIGNTITAGSNNVSFTDSIIELHTLPNLGNLTFNDGKDIGIRFHYYFTQDQNAALVLANDTGFLEWYGAFAAETANSNIGGNATYGTIKSGELLLANTTISTSSSTGALRVSGGAGVTGNIYTGGLGQHLGGLQNTPIGNLTPSTALFTTVVASGNTTASALTVNNSATIGTTLSISGTTTAAAITASGTVQPNANATVDFGASGAYWNNGYIKTLNAPSITGVLQTAAQTNITSVGTLTGLTLSGTLTGTTINATTIGNSGANFSGAIYTATNSFNGPHNGTLGAAGGNTAIVSTLSATGNTTVNALTVNNSATIGTTLNVTGNVIFNSNLGIDGGQVTIYDSILDLHTYSNLAPWTVDDGKDIGLRMHYYKGADTLAFLGIENTSNTLQFLQNATETNSNVTGTFGNVQFGSLTLSNSTISANTTSGALVVTGGVGVSGNLNVGSALSVLGGIQNTPIGNATASTGQFTTLSATGNITGASLTSNGSATVGTTLGVTGNVTASNLILTSNTISFANSSIVQVNPLSLAITGAYQIAVKPAGGSYQWTFNNDGTLTGPVTGVTLGIYTITATGGIQNTPIGNATASTGQFTTISSTGNVTAAALTSNASITATTTVSALGGLQATPIGNVAPSTAIFTSESVSGNSTVNALTVNNSATIGTTLGVTGNTNVGGNLNIGTGGNITGANIISANTFIAAVSFNGPVNGTLGSAGGNTAIVSTLSATGNATVNALTVNNSATAATLGISGNATIGNILSDHYYFANGAPFVSSQPGGTTGQFQYNTGSTFGGASNFNYVSGNGQIIANAGINSTNTGTGTMIITGGLGVSGQINASSESLTGNSTVNGVTVNNSATIGTNLSIGSNLIVSGTSTFNGNILGNTTHSANVIASGFFYANGTPVGANQGAAFTIITSNTQTGTGSQTNFTIPNANATTAGTIVSINGVVQQPVTAYSITGNVVTFTEAPASTDVIDFRILTTSQTITGTGTAEYVTQPTQSNITAVGTLTSLTVSGAINGTLATGTQYNITSVGTLNGLTLSDGLITNTPSVTVGTSATAIDTWSGSSYKAAKYVITARNSGSTVWTSLEVLVVTDGGSNASLTTYGIVTAGGANSQISMSTTASGGVVTVKATGATAGTVVNFSKHYIVGS